MDFVQDPGCMYGKEREVKDRKGGTYYYGLPLIHLGPDLCGKQREGGQVLKME